MDVTTNPTQDPLGAVPVINPGHSYKSLTDKLTGMVLTTNTPSVSRWRLLGVQVSLPMPCRVWGSADAFELVRSASLRCAQ